MQMFSEQSFKVFDIEGLEPRMAAIRSQIQPIFAELDNYFVSELAPSVGKSLPIHIAQHRRRTAYAPDFTWSAMGGDKRGYKKYPHFTLGINRDYLVMWLSFIDNPIAENVIATMFLNNPTLFATFPPDFVINQDHTKNTYLPFTSENLQSSIKRWQTVKKGEFQIGRIIKREHPILATPEAAREYMLVTYQLLSPLYTAAEISQAPYLSK